MSDNGITSTNSARFSDAEKRVAVIGAGGAGLCTAKWMLQSGFDVTEYEVGTCVGGIWVYQNDSGLSPAYKTLHINSDKDSTQFKDYPFPHSASLFPHHTEMRAYLENYAKHFGMYDHIRFNAAVTRITPELSDCGGDVYRWRVDDVSGRSDVYDAVVVATGHSSRPRHPEFAKNFTGEYLHSFDYEDPARFANKRVCVVGLGTSACDIASDICSVAERTVMAARSGTPVVPKLFLGKPIVQINQRLSKWWIPKSFRRWTLKWIAHLIQGDLEVYGVKKPAKGTRPSINGLLATHLAMRQIEIRPGVTRVDGQTIEFEDGSAEEFDSIIAATGYLFEEPLVSGIVDIADGHAPLFKRIVPPNWPGLFFAGLLQYQGAFFEAFDAQAKWIAEIIAGTYALPPEQEMVADIAEKEAHNKQVYSNSPRHYLEEVGVEYRKDLRKEQARGRRRAARRHATSASR
jgi:dimethylaniline monooxygenase (N-oxide forming)